jgi:mevalonate pyrophosphate decarboxylase
MIKFQKVPAVKIMNSVSKTFDVDNIPKETKKHKLHMHVCQCPAAFVLILHGLS